MVFLRDLIRWFLFGERRKNATSSQAVFNVENPAPVVEKKFVPPTSPTFDFLKENNPEAFLEDLKSIRPLAEQFDRAREELTRELQRLAPPKKRIFDIFRKAA